MHRQKSAPIGVLLAVFGGTFGLHRFHLGDARAGWLDVLLCWTGLPTLAGVVEAFAMPRRVRIYEAERSGEEAERVRWLTKRLGGWAASRGFPQMLKLWREADTIDRTFLALGLVLGVPVVLAAALYALAVIAYLAGAILGPWLYR